MSLHVLMSGQPIGELQSDRHGHPELLYRADWRESAGASPLSLSLPLGRSTHPTDVVSAVLWGLLPDNENTLQRWGSRFHVSPRNPVALLAHVGEDCAGAVQFAVIYESHGTRWQSCHRFEDVGQADAGALVLGEFLGAEVRR